MAGFLPPGHQDIINVPSISCDTCIGEELKYDPYRGPPSKGAQVNGGLSPGSICAREGGYLRECGAIVRSDPDSAEVIAAFEIVAVLKGQRD